MSDDTEDVCPICKSSRYFNPNLKFLVNPECYHKMCSNCVDRIFSMGSAPCPYPGCRKTLSKLKFKTQTFDDLGVEKEVDIRQRLMEIFNRQQDDFASLNEYNDYLEMVEDYIFNLANHIDVEATEKAIAQYRATNKDRIHDAYLRQKQDKEAMKQSIKEEQNIKRQLRESERELERAENEIKEQSKQDIVRRLAMSNADTQAITEAVNQEVEMKTQELRKRVEEARQKQQLLAQQRVSTSSDRKRAAVATPFTPFAGDRQTEYAFEERDDYLDPMIDDIKNDPLYYASGFDPAHAQKEALIKAFMGLGCNIQQEKMMLRNQMDVS